MPLAASPIFRVRQVTLTGELTLGSLDESVDCLGHHHLHLVDPLHFEAMAPSANCPFQVHRQRLKLPGNAVHDYLFRHLIDYQSI